MLDLISLGRGVRIISPKIGVFEVREPNQCVLRVGLKYIRERCSNYLTVRGSIRGVQAEPVRVGLE